MTPRLPYDPDAITQVEAAKLLGIGPHAVTRLRREGLLVETRRGNRSYSRSEIQAFLADPWLNGVGAAAVLGVTHNRVSQLAQADRIPYRLTTSGKRVYRRSQLQVVANARRARAIPRRAR